VSEQALEEDDETETKDQEVLALTAA